MNDCKFQNPENDIIQIYFNQNLKIFDCSFNRMIVYKGDCGIIYCKDYDVNLELFRTRFKECNLTLNGGFIFFTCLTSNSFGKFGNFCREIWKSSIGQFCYFTI